MSQEKPLDDLKETEAALASLVPRTGRLHRDRLMFEAGRASATAWNRAPRGRGWAWPAAFSAMTAVAAALLVMLVVRPMPQIAERPAPVPGPSAPALVDRGEPPQTPLGAPASRPGTQTPEKGVARLPAAYPRMLARVLEQGVDALPQGSESPLSAPAGDRRPASYWEYREELLDGPSAPAANHRAPIGPFQSGAKS